MKTLQEIVDNFNNVEQVDEAVTSTRGYAEKAAIEFIKTYKILPQRDKLPMIDYINKFLDTAYSYITKDSQNDFIDGVQNFLEKIK